MARKFKGILKEGFLDFVETNGLNSFGYINVTTRDKKIGKIYVRYGTIIAVENENYRTNILERVVSIEGVNERSEATLRKRYDSDPGNINLVESAMDQQMASSHELSKIIKENFIDSFYDIWQWGQVNMEWVANKEPNIPTVPAIQPTDLIQKAELIETKIKNEIAPMLNVEPEQILALKPVIGDNHDYSELRPNETTILQYSTSEHSLEDIIYGTGLSLSGSQFAVARLWLNRHVFLTGFNGELISFQSKEDTTLETSDIEEETTQYENIEPNFDSITPNTSETPIITDISDLTEMTIEETETEDNPEEETETTELSLANFFGEETEHTDTTTGVISAIYESDEEEDEYNNTIETSYDTTPEPTEIEEPEPTRLRTPPRKLSFEEALAMTDNEEQAQTETLTTKTDEQEELITTETSEEKKTDMNTSNDSTGSRLSGIVAQLQNLMDEARESLKESEQAVHDKKEELDDLLTQKRELTSRIMETEEDHSSLIEARQSAYKEYQSMVQQLKNMEGML